MDPDVVGVSLLHAGQVIPAAATSLVARSIWPDALIVWGGPHISGLGARTLEKDLVERAFVADIFVTAHAEKTFTHILDEVGRNKLRKKPNKPLVLNGTSGEMTFAPTFDNLELYDKPWTLPAQSSVGCSYGKCAFFTYPAIEPKPARLDLNIAVGPVAVIAETEGASISIKGSLLTAKRPREIGECIANRAPWSACTKLSNRLDLDLLQRLRENGLLTLEVGLEACWPKPRDALERSSHKHTLKNSLPMWRRLMT